MTLKKAYSKACQKSRHELLFGTKINKQLDAVRIVTTYSNNHCMVKETLDRYWQILTGDPILRKYIADHPQLKCRSLKDRLVHSHFQEPLVTIESRKGIHQCGMCEY